MSQQIDLAAIIPKSRIVRLYRFYNFRAGEHGKPFALCDQHIANQRVPSNCRLERIGETTQLKCEDCKNGRNT